MTSRQEILAGILDSHNRYYTEITEEESLEKIYQLFTTHQSWTAFPNNPIEFLYFGTYHLDNGQAEWGLKLLEQSQLGDADKRIGKYYDEERKDVNKAREYYFRALEKGCTRVYHDIFFLLQSQAEPFNILSQAIHQRAIYDEFALETLARIAWEENNFVDMLRWAKAWLKVTREPTRYPFNLIAHAYYGLGNFKKMKKYHRLENSAGGYREIGAYYHEKEKYVPAETNYLQAIALGDVLANHSLGLIYYQEDRLDEAVACYSRAFELGYSPAGITLGLFYVESGDRKKAKQWFLASGKQGEFKAYAHLAEFYLSKLSPGESTSKPKRYARKAFRHGCKKGAYLMGKCYKIKHYLRNRADSAIKYFYLALPKKKAITDLLNCYSGCLFNSREHWLEAVMACFICLSVGKSDELGVEEQLKYYLSRLTCPRLKCQILLNLDVSDETLSSFRVVKEAYWQGLVEGWLSEPSYFRERCNRDILSVIYLYLSTTTSLSTGSIFQNGLGAYVPPS